MSLSGAVKGVEPLEQLIAFDYLQKDNSAPTGRIFMKLDISASFENLSRVFTVINI
jgi:hypothetical protein